MTDPTRSRATRADWAGAAPSGARSPYGRRQAPRARRLAGIAVVVILHVLLVYALINGLATKVVHVIAHPIETKIIEPVKPPPPPPLPPVQLPPPKFAPPPPPFVPPPEVPVQAPPRQSIVHQAAPAPTAPVQPSAPAPAAPAAKPVSHEVSVVCPNSEQVRAAVRYPREAQKNGDTGDVLIEFTVDPQGHIANVRVAKSSDHDSLDEAAFNAVKKFDCVAQGEAVRVQVPFSFNLN